MVGVLRTSISVRGRSIKTETPSEGDWRLTTPRYQGEAYAANVALVDEIEALASTKSCTPAQLALAWVISRGEHVMPLMGTTKLEHLKSNLGSYDVELSDNEKMILNALADRVIGDRYDERGMASING